MKNVFFFILFTFYLNFTGFAKENPRFQFIKNNGQWENIVNYKCDVPGGSIHFADNQIAYTFYSQKDLEHIHDLKHEEKDVTNEKINCHAYKINFLGANKNPKTNGREKLPNYNNYFIGNDKNKWQGNVPLFSEISYQNLYNGIELKIYNSTSNLKYDFVVAKNANPNVIQMKYDGVLPLINSEGALLIKTSLNEIIENRPYCYQIIDGKKVEVASKYKLVNNVLSYEFPEGYNKNEVLIIDPSLVFSTYSGSTAMTFGWSACYDLNGNFYSGGECFGVGWPVTVGVFQTTFGGSIDASVNVYNTTGSALIYSTYLGGSSSDFPNSMICNTNNELILCGQTSSANFPTLAGAVQTVNAGGQDLYITHFNSTGTALIGSTYIGGSATDGVSNHEVNICNNGDIIVASITNSSNFPTTAGAFQTTFSGISDGIFLRINSTCTSLLFSSLLGGNSTDQVYSIKEKNNGNLIVCGSTSSSNFPTTAGAFHTASLGSQDGFVSIFNSSGSTLLNSTYIGTAGFDYAYRVQIDQNNGNIYICGSGATYPISPSVYNQPSGTIFVEILNPTLSSSILSTRFGDGSPTAFLLDVCGNVYVSTQGTGGPLTANAYQVGGGFWIGVMQPMFSGLLYGTDIGQAGDHIDGGSSRFDPQGIIYQSICTISTGVYSSVGSWSPVKQSGSWDVASVKFLFGYTSATSLFDILPNDSICLGDTVNFLDMSSSASLWDWDFGDGNTSSLQNPSHFYALPGQYTVRLIASNISALCNSADTSYKTINVFEIENPIINLKDTTVCGLGNSLQLQSNISNWQPSMTIDWQPSAGIISGSNTMNPTVNPNVSTTYTITVSNSIANLNCDKSVSKTISILVVDTNTFSLTPPNDAFCPGDSIFLQASGGVIYEWSPNTGITNNTQSTVTLKPNMSTTYSIKIIDKDGCFGIRTCNVTVHPEAVAEAGENQIIKYGESIELNASGGNIYTWTNDPTLSNLTIQNPVATPLTHTTYYVKVDNEFGCGSNDSVTIFVTNAMIPNAFTPNGDGKNDIFKFIVTNEYVTLENLSIYNRFGEKVFETNTPDYGWNGTYKGKNSDVGTYFYLLNYKIGKRKFTEKGDITLVR
ncbi:MAG: gliding motility-associated C-terminal domain-containing protein [Chitinophagaceae bacterium]|nr:gliding motility-associated C-terminal domain-containing protein [Chitinophagaceae bacterium]